MTAPRTITAAERLARKGQTAPSTPQPIAQWKKKGCRTCQSIPVYSKPVQAVDPSP